MEDNYLIYEEAKAYCLENDCDSEKMIATIAMDRAQKEYYNYLYHEACRLNDNNIMEFLESKEI